MKLYLMRHGVAALRGDPAWPDDRERPLTDDGQRKVRQAARGLLALDVRLDLVLTSPLLRARQTASTVAKVLGLRASQLRETGALRPGEPLDVILRELAPEPPQSAVLLVGHEPDLSHLAGVLLAGGEPPIDMPFKKACLCLVEVRNMPPSERATLHFLLQPAQLRALVDLKRAR